MTSGTVDTYQIAARMERLPVSRWHHKMRLIGGSANFSHAFDGLPIAYVLPVLIPLWHLSEAEIGLLISIGYVGQVIGGVLSGWLADRHGRGGGVAAKRVVFS